MQWIQNHWGDLRGPGRRYRRTSITRRDGRCYGPIANVPDGVAVAPDGRTVVVADIDRDCIVIL